MPRQPRLDAPGLLHHVIARGLERRIIFHDKDDYEDILERVEASLVKSPNQILAWALMPNHFHFLIRSGKEGLSRFMRRLMSGYAVAFNIRHKRSGYLFQNRYKSIVCDEAVYLDELVRYIHLNPLRAKLVRSIDALASFPYSGHSALMGKVQRPWQETSEVLARFGSRDRYERFVEQGKDQGRRPELVGGGLVRSRGGVGEALRARREDDREAFDPRILGSGDFVEKVLKETEVLERGKSILRRKGIDLRSTAKRLAQEVGVGEQELFSRGRTAPVSRAKAILTFIGVEYFGKSMTEMAGLTKMTPAAGSKARERGLVLFQESPIREWLLN